MKNLMRQVTINRKYKLTSLSNLFLLAISTTTENNKDTKEGKGKKFLRILNVIQRTIKSREKGVRTTPRSIQLDCAKQPRPSSL